LALDFSKFSRDRRNSVQVAVDEAASGQRYAWFPASLSNFSASQLLVPVYPGFQACVSLKTQADAAYPANSGECARFWSANPLNLPPGRQSSGWQPGRHLPGIGCLHPVILR